MDNMDYYSMYALDLQFAGTSNIDLHYVNSYEMVNMQRSIHPSRGFLANT